MIGRATTCGSRTASTTRRDARPQDRGRRGVHRHGATRARDRWWPGVLDRRGHRAALPRRARRAVPPAARRTSRSSSPAASRSACSRSELASQRSWEHVQADERRCHLIGPTTLPARGRRWRSTGGCRTATTCSSTAILGAQAPLTEAPRRAAVHHAAPDVRALDEASRCTSCTAHGTPSPPIACSRRSRCSAGSPGSSSS